MSGGGGEAPKAAPAAPAAPAKDPYVDLAERIFVNLSARVYGTLAGSDQKKPDPKALAAFCFKLADAFEQATNETPRKLAEIEARNKASVKLDEVDLSAVFKATAAAPKPAAAPEPAKK
jgi:hypothetical protein